MINVLTYGCHGGHRSMPITEMFQASCSFDICILVVGRIQLHENQERGALAIFLPDSLVFRMLVSACRNQEMVQQVFASAEKNEGIQKHVSQYFMF